jgi:hypothetical protein
MCLFIHTWLDPQKTSYGFGYGSFLVPGRTHPCPGGGHLRHQLASVVEPVPGRRIARHFIHNISGSHPRHRPALAIAVVHTHTHTLGMPPPPLGSVEVPRSCHLSTFCAWNWGPQPQFTAASNGGYVGDPGKGWR